MSRPRFLADHNFAECVVDGVLRREPAAEFQRLREVRGARWNDAQVLEYAASHDLIVVSHDVNTMSAEAYARLRRGQVMKGLLLASQATGVGAIIESLVMIWAASEAEEWEGVVKFLPL